MELLILIAVIYVLAKIAGGVKSSRSDRQSPPPRTGSSTGSPPRSSPAARPPSKDTYRPNASRSSSDIVFGHSASASSSSQRVSPEDLRDLCDAFTGEKLDLAKGLFRCEKCKVHYHAESYQVLRTENRGACVACGSTNLVSVAAGTANASSGRNYDPNVVTLTDIRRHVGRVVTFEGYVHSVEVSRRGTDYAVMFESKSWVKGFKLVFFKGAARKVGGEAFIKGLKGRTVKVRGLVVDHATFGMEIIVSERSMILSVR